MAERARSVKPRRHQSGLWFAAIGPPDSRGKAGYLYFPRDQVKTERQAWSYLEKVLRERAARSVSAADPTVYWLFQLYLEWAERRYEAGKMTRHHYRCQVSRLSLVWDTAPAPGAEPLRDRPARSVAPEDLQGCVEAWERAGYSAHYVKGLVRAVRAAYRWGAAPLRGRDPDDPARPVRWLAEDPLTGFAGPKLPEAPDRFVAGATVRRFLRWAWARARRGGSRDLTRRFDRLYLLMVWFMRLTGCRPGEACRLRWDQIDRAKDIAVMPGKATAKTGKPRTIDLTPPVWRILRAVERLEGHHPVFVFTHMRGRGAAGRGELDPRAGEPWPDGSAASAKMRGLRAAAIAAGVPGLAAIGPKRLVQYTNRHNYASTALMRGLTSSEAAELLGNTPQMIEQVYGHIQRDHTARRARELAARRGSAPDSPRRDEPA